MNEAAVGLIDIIEPSAPLPDMASSIFWPAVAVALFALLVISLTILWRKKRFARLALKRSKILRQIASSGALTNHEMVFLIAVELRRGLSLDRLLFDELPLAFKGGDLALWPAFIRRLDALRYQPGMALDNQQLEALFVQTENWLRRYSR